MQTALESHPAFAPLTLTRAGKLAYMRANGYMPIPTSTPVRVPWYRRLARFFGL